MVCRKAVPMVGFVGPLVVIQVDDPAAPADGVVVEVQAIGICRSDWYGCGVGLSAVVIDRF
jgi:alcohol dehydrogenase